ncbi:hypothetical protein [Methanothermobacter sp.]|nr:hypothetical protein [Methanothermobacter sp.]MDI9617690.1 hypothetical protein [Methanothermobacter sp.]
MKDEVPSKLEKLQDYLRILRNSPEDLKEDVTLRGQLKGTLRFP